MSFISSAARGPSSHAQFTDDILTVAVYRMDTDSQDIGYLFARFSISDQPQDFLLAASQHVRTSFAGGYGNPFAG